MSLSVEVSGLNELVHDVKKAGGDASGLVRAAIFNSATETQRNIRHNAPHRTGALQQRVLTTITATSASIYAEEKYARYVELGTRPHTIQPKRKMALYWKGAASPYAIVHHPGTRANPFFSKGVKQSRAYIQEQFTKVMDRLLKELAGKA